MRAGCRGRSQCRAGRFAQGRIVCPSPGGQRSYPGKVSSRAPYRARVIPLRPATPVAAARPARTATPAAGPGTGQAHTIRRGPRPVAVVKEPLWRHIVGDVLRRERLGQERRLRDVADEARISMPYLSEIERGRKEASSEVLAAAAHALGLSLADLLSLAQDELARLSPDEQPEQVSRAERPSRPTPARDLDSERTVSPDGDSALAAPAGQPATAEARLASSELGPVGVDVAGEGRLMMDGIGSVVVGATDEAKVASGDVESAEILVADEVQVDLRGIGPVGVDVAGQDDLDSGEVVPIESRLADQAGPSSGQVKLSLAA
jgi:transcriptional regulator with XRE-family HTH domain